MVKYIKTYPERCTGCRECEQVCSLFHWKVVNPYRAGIRIERKGVVEHFQYICNHGVNCNFECMEACKFGAIKKEKGIVFIDHNTCTGCGACTRACPNQAVWLFDGKAYKCDLCMEDGKPKCVEVCSQKALEVVE